MTDQEHLNLLVALGHLNALVAKLEVRLVELERLERLVDKLKSEEAPRLKQWMQDMTGPEDASVRSQYVRLVTAARVVAGKADHHTIQGLLDALRAAGELE